MPKEANLAFLDNLKNVLKISKEAPVLIHSGSGKLFIGSHNDYHSVVVESPSEWQDFKAVISNEVARQVARAVTEDRLNFSIDQDTLKVSSKGIKLNIPTLDSPMTTAKLLTKFSKSGDYFVNGKDFKDAVNLVKHAANDRSIGDVVLRGYHMTARDSHFEVMASNGAVMALTRVSYSGLSDSTPPDDTVYLLNPEFHQVSDLFLGEVDVSPSEGTLSFQSSHELSTVYAVSNLTQGTPAPYSAVLETVEKNPTSVIINTRNLYEAIRRIDFFTDDSKNNRVTMRIQEHEIEVVTHNQHGHSSVRVETSSSKNLPQDGLELTTSWSYLIGFFSSAKGEETEILIKDPTSPIMLKSEFLEEVVVLFYN